MTDLTGFLRFAGRRALSAIVVVWAACTLMFGVFFIAPGDRVAQIIGGDRVVTAEHRLAVEERFGLNEPVLVQYGRYWERLAHGDLGVSFADGRSVTQILSDTVPSSARLAFWAFVVQITAGVSSGVLLAVTRRRWLRHAINLWTALALAVPVFALGYLLQLAFGVYPFQHGWPEWAEFPVQGIGPDRWAFGVIPMEDQWRYLLLPVLTLATVSSAVTSRLTGASLSAVMRRDFIRGARSKGLRERQVIIRHGVRNAMAPVVALVGLDLANLFGSAVVTEYVFNWPGIGSEAADALGRQDAPVVLGIALVLALVYVIANFAVDVIQALLDPRVREKHA